MRRGGGQHLERAARRRAGLAHVVPRAGHTAPTVPVRIKRSTPPDSDTPVRSRIALDRLIARRDIHVREKTRTPQTCPRHGRRRPRRLPDTGPRAAVLRTGPRPARRRDRHRRTRHRLGSAELRHSGLTHLGEAGRRCLAHGQIAPPQTREPAPILRTLTRSHTGDHQPAWTRSRLALTPSRLCPGDTILTDTSTVGSR